MTSCRPPIAVLSNELVDTFQVNFFRVSKGSHEGRYFKIRVEEENSVNPVSLGDGVTPVKNWKL